MVQSQRGTVAGGYDECSALRDALWRPRTVSVSNGSQQREHPRMLRGVNPACGGRA